MESRMKTSSTCEATCAELTPSHACPVRNEILTLEETARVLGLGRKDPARSARDFIRRHGVPHIEVSRESWYVLQSSLVEWMRDREERAYSKLNLDSIVAEMVSEDGAMIENAVN
jgi:hypothetical protein